MTFQQYWAEAQTRYGALDRSWIDCDEDFYMEMLKAVPPHYPDGHHGGPLGYCFASGEPWDHTSTGEPLYLCFRDKPGFACRMATLAEFNLELKEGALGKGRKIVA